MRIITTGRVDVADYFRLSSICEKKKLLHHPFVVFVESDDNVGVRIVDNAANLLAYPDETKVMAQWGGQYRSDFFQFTVGQFRRYISDNPKEPYHVV
jgi:hypothetical protein